MEAGIFPEASFTGLLQSPDARFFFSILNPNPVVEPSQSLPAIPYKFLID